MMYLAALILVIAIIFPLFYAYYQKVSGKHVKRVKKTLLFNLSAFAIVCLLGVVLPIGGIAMAGTAAADVISTGKGLAYLAAALATGISGIGGGIAVASGSSSAIGAITEDPKVFGKSLIFVGLGEGVALYGFVIGLMIVTSL